MTRQRRRRLMFVLVLMLGLALAVGLTLSAVSKNMMYFYEPSDIAAGAVPNNTRFRVGGLVQQGSVEHDDNGLSVRFVLADCEDSVAVNYDGILPDLFREGQGIIAYGKLNDRGQFIADKILAKHDATYKSPAVAKATTDDQGVSCMPADLQVSK